MTAYATVPRLVNKIRHHAFESYCTLKSATIPYVQANTKKMDVGITMSAPTHQRPDSPKNKSTGMPAHKVKRLIVKERKA